MTYFNPHLRMRWTDIPARFLFEDVDEFVERMRQLYPDMVLFARSMHFRPPSEADKYLTVPIKFWQNAGHYREDPYLAGKLPAYGLALRVPWPEDFSGHDPERLIGGRGRKAYEDGRAQYRRFGRTVYFGMVISDEIVFANREVIAKITGIELANVPPIRLRKHRLTRMGFEILHDSEDPDLIAFVRAVRHCLRGLGVTTAGSYDVITGEPVHTSDTLTESKRWMKRCALEEHLYCGPASRIGDHVLFTGPAPAALKKWRHEANLPYGKATDPKTLEKLDTRALMARHREGLISRLPDSIEKSPAQFTDQES